MQFPLAFYARNMDVSYRYLVTHLRTVGSKLFLVFVQFYLTNYLSELRPVVEAASEALTFEDITRNFALRTEFCFVVQLKRLHWQVSVKENKTYARFCLASPRMGNLLTSIQKLYFS